MCLKKMHDFVPGVLSKLCVRAGLCPGTSPCFCACYLEESGSTRPTGGSDDWNLPDGRGTFCHWQIFSTSKKLGNYPCRNNVVGCDTEQAALVVNHKAAELICTQGK